MGDQISSYCIKGNKIAGEVTAIGENTVVVMAESKAFVVLKRLLKDQGYSFASVDKSRKQISVVGKKKQVAEGEKS